MRYTPEIDTAIRECYRAGGNVAEVAARFGLNRNKIIGRANRIGAKHANPHMPHDPSKCAHWGPRNAERDRAICELLVAGWSGLRVAAEYGICPSRVYQIRARHLKRTVVWEWRE